MTAPADKAAGARIATNRKAFREFHVLERIEAGVALRGTEVKSAREGNVTLTGGFAAIEDGEVVLRDVHIAPYVKGNRFNHDPARPRRLLLHRQQIKRLVGQLSQKGFTLVPLNLYFRRGLLKVEIGVCRGKQTRDKREELRRDAANREVRRAATEA